MLKLVPAEKRQLPWVIRLYKSAFPRQEQKPIWLIKKRRRKGIIEVLLIMDGEQPAGFAIAAPFEERVLLAYFAVAPEGRGKGTGSEALSLIRRRYEGKSLFLEIEALDERAENAEQRARRKAFYLRNGMRESGFFSRLAGMKMEVLIAGEDLDFERYFQVYEGVMGPRIAKKVVQRAE